MYVDYLRHQASGDGVMYFISEIQGSVRWNLCWEHSDSIFVVPTWENFYEICELP